MGRELSQTNSQLRRASVLLTSHYLEFPVRGSGASLGVGVGCRGLCASQVGLVTTGNPLMGLHVCDAQHNLVMFQEQEHGLWVFKWLQ